MRRYAEVLRHRPFAALWAGSTISAIGDSLTWVALVWLVLSRGSAAAVGTLVVVSTAPVIVGGMVMGALLDRFDRRGLLIAVNLFLGTVVGCVPLLHRLGALRLWHLYVVAATYGLLKMANWAGVPSLVPSLVPAEDLNTANAMESVSFGLADVAGPAVAGLLVAMVGETNVLLVDAASYLAFVGVLMNLRVPASPSGRAAGVEAAGGPASGGPARGLRPAFAFLRREPAVLATTLMFMAFNVGEGILLVLLPVLARTELGGGPRTYGLLVSAFALAGVAGSFAIGALRWRRSLGRSVAGAQAAAGASFLGLLAASGPFGAATALVVAGVLTSPLTIWAQTIRMRLIPESMRGRVFGTLRTLMQSTPPIGGALAPVLLAGPGVAGAVVAMAALMALPGIVGLVHPALADANTWPASESPLARVSVR